ncbi:hypothetical protein H8S90_08880 [Olivibacter sp. SDN3]|uniref:hypothetical protein n=1 Tax=Olivibacter sp. SDN3 TaxID=2764720 RepID=UPI0016516683|nr:hypothetical protein [Olivibacter sp. SDN3]QNL51667.1 hypothetical protein H8S90_08880 [Olivibacter sp. SDN3]
MKKIACNMFIGLCIGVMLQACNTTTPEKYISVTALNSNLVSSAYRPMFLEELMERKGKDQLAGTTAVDYVRDRALRPVEESMEKVKQLKETDDTQALIAAALDLMAYGKEIFESDYIAIAQLIDEGKPEEEIDAAITEMYAKTENGMAQRFDELDELALAYAQEHDVPFEVR